MNTFLRPKPESEPKILKYPSDLKLRYKALHTDMLAQIEHSIAAENYWLSWTLVGWQLMLTCAISQYMVQVLKLQEPRWPYIVVWAVQLVAALATMHLLEGKSDVEQSPFGPLVRRVCAIFIILCWNVVGLNALGGFPVFAFLPVLATLSSFLFLVLAAFLTPRFIAAALVMFGAGTAMALAPAHGFLIYGAGWLIVLQTMGVIFRKRQSRWLS
jgi:hypothetical protein